MHKVIALALAAATGFSPVETASLLHRNYLRWLRPNMTLEDVLQGARKSFDFMDTNKDGVLSSADLRGNERKGYRPGWIFDPAPKVDGEYTWDSVREYVTKIFAAMDLNHDGILSRDELNSFTERQILIEYGDPQPPDNPGCDFPKPSSDANILLLSAYETYALASASMHDTEVRAGLITVEPGTQPLYVILDTYAPVIWTFKGDTTRIERVLLSSYETGPNSSNPKNGLPLVGAVGVNRDKVSFAPNPTCLKYFDEVPSLQSVLTSRFVGRQLGRSPAVVSAAYKVADSICRKVVWFRIARMKFFGETCGSRKISSIRGVLSRQIPKPSSPASPCTRRRFFRASLGCANSSSWER